MFKRELFQFLVELKFNNERAWFNANKGRYEEFLKEPMQAFLQEFEKPLRRIHPAFGMGRIFRIHRDTRFSKDKTPYKTHLAAQFRHRAASQDVHAPGFYLHIEPGESFMGAGIWQPEAAPLLKIRKAIATKPKDWAPLSKLPLWGESLKRPPKGFDAEHPYIQDIKRKHFITWVDFKDKEVLSADFQSRCAAACKKMNPLMLFLCKALGLKN